MPFRSLFAGFAVCWLALAPPAAAQLGGERNVQTELVSVRASVAPGERFTVALRQIINEGWHTYWLNPGAAGEPAEITWTAPAGLQAGAIQWPTPHAVEAAGLWNYGYEDEVLLPLEVTAPESLRPGDDLTLTADVFLVVCSEDLCIPEESVVTLTLPTAAQGTDDPQWSQRIGAQLAAAPRADAGIEARITAGDPATLSVAYAGAVEDPYFFPRSRDALDYGVAQRVSVGAQGFAIALASGVERLGDAPLEGLITFTDAQGQTHAYEIAAQPGAILPGAQGAPAAAAPLAAPALLAALAFAFIGGLILNIMPCVLPVLSVKALSFAGGVQAGEARRHGLLYAAGVLTTFLALAALLIALRSGGQAIGWGFQFQSPIVTGALALLFFAIGLNLLNVFSLGGSLQNAGAGAASRGGDAGAFFTGALAVVAATPCTAPFMAGAIGAVLTQSAGVTLLVFGALALGFALPLTLLHFAPGLQRLVPKPGLWMERVKQVLAFPMFGAAIWLAWVLTEQSGPLGGAALLSIAAALGFALLAARWGVRWRAVGAAVFLATALIAWRPLVGERDEATLVSEAWSPARVSELRGEGRGVFVNFTAAWCVTCKVNEAAVLRNPEIAALFSDENVAYLTADWTNRDAEIAAALAAHGRAGVPLYLYYPPQGDVLVLPQMLSEELMLRTIMGDAS